MVSKKDKSKKLKDIELEIYHFQRIVQLLSDLKFHEDKLDEIHKKGRKKTKNTKRRDT